MPPLMRRHYLLAALAAIYLTACSRATREDAGTTVSIATASNFAACIADLEHAFSKVHPEIDWAISVGSSSQLAAQISHGAPFHLFLSADQKRVDAIIDSGQAIADTRITYAWGRLAIVGVDPIDAMRLAIANPELAPYGFAAQQWLKAEKMWPELSDRLVIGQSVGQAYQFYASGNADSAIIALSQAVAADIDFQAISLKETSPIPQEAIALVDTPATRTSIDFLSSELAQQIIEQHGYRLPRKE